ncbi:hypothetical protein BH09SUM1_BH09SUM1_29670 [soil metagenome]
MEWAWTRSVPGPPGLRLPAEWLRREFPEFAAAELDPFIEYLLNFDSMGSPRKGYSVDGSRPHRMRGMAFWFTVLPILLIAMTYAFRLQRFMFIPFIWGAFWVLKLLKSGNLLKNMRLPRTPGGILLCQQPAVLQEVHMVPIASRDLLLTEIARRHLFAVEWKSPWILLSIYFVIPVAFGYLANSFLVGACSLVPISVLDFYSECSRGVAALRALSRTQQLLYQGRSGTPRRLFWRQILQQLRSVVSGLKIRCAGIFFRLPVTLCVVAIVCVTVVATRVFGFQAIPCAAIPFFIMARSPLPVYVHRQTRYMVHTSFVRLRRGADITRWKLRRQVFEGGKP